MRYADVVTVRPAVKTRNSVGGWDITPGAPVPVSCAVEPVTSTDTDDAGNVQVMSLYRVFPDPAGPAWPGGSYSTVTWGTRHFSQVAEAAVYARGYGTRHTEVLMQESAVEVR